MSLTLARIQRALAIMALVAFVLLPIVRVAEAATGSPKIINYQARLLDSNGNLLGGSGTEYCFTFSFYDTATSGTGTKIWPTTNPSTTTVMVKNGIFNVGIGDTSHGGDALDFDFNSTDEIYLNVQVAAKVGATCATGDGAETYETFTSRPRINSSGYAQNANTVGGFSASQNPTGNQIPVLSGGNLKMSGGIEVGNATTTNATTTNLAVTGNASTSNLVVSNGFTFGNFTGILKAVAGSVVAALVDLATDVQGVLGVGNGGTGWAYVASGAVLFGNGSGALATTTAGTPGYVLSYLNGVPTWTATSTYAYPLVNTGNVVSLVFGTTTANTWATTQAFSDITAGTATVGTLTATSSAMLASTTAQGRFITGNVIATSSATSTFVGPVAIGTTVSSYKLSVVGSTSAVTSATGTSIAAFTNTASQLSSGTNVLRLNIRTPYGTACVTGSTCPRFTEFFAGVPNNSDTGGIGVGSIRLTAAGTGITQTSGSADFAEFMLLNSSASAGDVVSLNASGEYQKAVAGQSLIGVVSDNPAFVGNGNIEGQTNAYIVGFAGVINTTVSTDNGPIAAGDLITAGNTAGVGVKLVNSGYALGQALESFSGPGNGTVKVLVFPKYVDAAVALSSYGGSQGGVSGYWSLATSTGVVSLASSTYTTASTSNLVVSNGFTLGHVSGVLKANLGAVAASLLDLSSDVTSILGIGNGGTGTSTAPTYGKILVGNAAGTYTMMSTSSLGIVSAQWGNITGTLSDQTDLQSALDAKFSLSSWYATTTDGLREGTSNLYFSNDRVAGVIAGTTTDALAEGGTNKYYHDTSVRTYLDSIGKGYFFATSSADYWDTTKWRWSTSSSDYWLTTKSLSAFSTTSADYWVTTYPKGFFFSTTSTDYWKTQQDFFSTTSVNAWESTQWRWATTSATYFLGQNQGLAFSTSSANAWEATQWRWATSSANNFESTFSRWATTSSNYWLSTKNTDDLGEGSANLYFNQNRVAGVIAGTTTDALAQGSVNKYYSTLLFAADLAATSTDALKEGVINKYYKDSNVQTYLDSLGKGYFFSTTSAAYFLSQNQGLAFSTSSSDFAVGQYISGSSTIPHAKGTAFGDLLLWNGSTWATGATSSLAINTNNIFEGNNLFFTANRVASVIAGTTTDALAEGLNNKYYHDSSVQTYLDSIGKGYFFSTTSSDYWLTTKSLSAFSTTSADYWVTTYPKGFFFSTTSTDYWKTQQDFFSTTSVNAWESTQWRWATTSATYFLGQNQGLAFSTSSANAWEATQWRWATSSANNFESTFSRWATTSSNYWLSTKNTDDLGEGSANLYFNQNRVAGVIAGTTTDALAQGSVNKYYSSLLFAADLAATSTDALQEGSINKYYHDTSVQAYLDSIGKGYFFSTTSASYFLSQNQGLAFSTSSSDFAVGQYISGSSTIPHAKGAAFGDLLLWNGSTWATGATSSLAINTNNIFEGNNLFFTANRVASVIAGTTTDALAEGLNNKYYHDSSVQTYLDSIGKGYFFSTTSSDYWLTTKSLSAFSTTSADYWDTTKWRWSTSSSDFAVNAFISGSSTIPKTFASNSWSLLQLFSGGASTTNLSVFNTLFVGGNATTTIQGDILGTSTIQGYINVSGASNSTSTFSHNVFMNGRVQATSMITGSSFNSTSNATSSFSGGISITGGCVQVNGQCLAAPGQNSGTLVNIQVFSTPGTTTYTASPGATSAMVVVTGGGGGGGGADGDGTTNEAPGGGGGAGGTSIYFLDLSSTSSVQVVVGTGGQGGSGATGSNGGNGTYSWFGQPIIVGAEGGLGGTGIPSADTVAAPRGISGGAGAVASTSGTVKLAGGAGPDGIAPLNNQAFAGSGGASYWGPGGPGGTVTTTATVNVGTNGSNYGSGGGGGAVADSAAGANGGGGASGAVVVYEYGPYQGIMGLNQGGTGTSSPGAYGNVLAWNVDHWEGIATSSLGLTAQGQWGLILGDITQQTDLLSAIASTTNHSIFGRLFVGGGATTTIRGDNATSTFSGGIQTSALDINGTATSTFGNGINLATGCFSIAGACLLSGAQVNAANSWTQLQTFNQGFISQASSTITGLAVLSGGATTTNLTVSGTGYFGTASTTNLIVSGSGTSTFAGKVLIGVNNANYFPNAPLVMTSDINSYAQMIMQNKNTGNRSSADMVIGADLMSDTAYYGDLGYNSSAYNDPLYSGFGANALYLYNSDGELDLGSATTAISGAIKFFTGTSSVSGERMRITQGGIGIGTTTPYFGLTISTSTGAQLALTDGSTGNFSWAVRAISNNFFLATSTYNATSSAAALSINGATSAFTFNSGATSTFTSGLQSGPHLINGFIQQSGGATSTFSNGINLNTGCFSINGACITSGTGSSASSTLLSDSNTWGGVNIFNNSVTLTKATSSAFAITGLSNTLLFANTNGSVVGSSTLAVNIGGTGSTTLGGILTGNGTGVLTSAVIGTGLQFSSNQLSCLAASGTQTGCLTLNDWTTFNGKLGSSTINSLSANYLPRWTGNAFANSSIYDTGTAIGVGTTTPYYAITAASSTGAQLALSDGSTGNFSWTFRSAGNSFFIASSTYSATSSLSALVINGSNRAFTFNANATSTFTSGLQATALNINGSATSTFANGINISGGCFSVNGACIGGGGATAAGTTNGQIQFYSGGNLGYDAGFTWDSTNDRLGVGTSSPWAKLSVSANAGESNQYLFLISSSTLTATTTLFSVDRTGLTTIGDTSGTGDATMQFAADANAWAVGYASSTKAFQIASSTALGGSNVYMSILKNGRVGFGTSSPFATMSIMQNGTASASTTYMMWVHSGTASTSPAFAVGSPNDMGRVYISATSSGATSSNAVLFVGNSTFSAGPIAYFRNTSGLCSILPANGVACSSDARLKKNFSAIASSSALSSLLSLNPVFYNWTAEQDGSQQHAGFIAQQVEQTLPDLVQNDDFGYKMMNYAGLTPYLVSAVQELSGRVSSIASSTAASSTSSLDQRVRSLESQVAALATISFATSSSVAGSSGLNLTDANIWTGLQTFSGAASSTALSAYDYISVGGSATTTIRGDATSTFAAPIETPVISVTSTTATSTFANGINVTGGCIAVDGTCMTGDSGWTKEFMVDDDSIVQGDIVSLSGSSSMLIKAHAGLQVAGVVVASSSAFSENGRKVKFAGPAIVRVNLEGGTIAAGDALALSSVAGVAKRAGELDDVLGTAMENWDGSSGDTMQVFLQTQKGDTAARIAQKLLASSATSSDSASGPLDFIGQVMDAIASRLSTMAGIPQASTTNATSTGTSLLDTLRFLRGNTSTSTQLAALSIALVQGTTTPEEKDSVRMRLDDDGALIVERVGGDPLKVHFEDGSSAPNALLVSIDSQGNASFAGTLAAAGLVVGAPDKPSGITMYDEETGDPYCSKVVGGFLKTFPGKCGQESSVASQTAAAAGSDPLAASAAPIIMIQGNNPAYIDVGATYADLGATVTDDHDQNVRIHTFLNGVEVQEVQIDTSTSTVYTIRYQATDSDGNVSDARRIVVVGDGGTGTGSSNDSANTSAGTSSGGGTPSAENSSGSASDTSAADTSQAQVSESTTSVDTATTGSPSPDTSSTSDASAPSQAVQSDTTATSTDGSGAVIN